MSSSLPLARVAQNAPASRTIGRRRRYRTRQVLLFAASGAQLLYDTSLSARGQLALRIGRSHHRNLIIRRSSSIAVVELDRIAVHGDLPPSVAAALLLGFLVPEVLPSHLGQLLASLEPVPSLAERTLTGQDRTGQEKERTGGVRVSAGMGSTNTISGHVDICGSSRVHCGREGREKERTKNPVPMKVAITKYLEIVKRATRAWGLFSTPFLKQNTRCQTKKGGVLRHGCCRRLGREGTAEEPQETRWKETSKTIAQRATPGGEGNHCVSPNNLAQSLPRGRDEAKQRNLAQNVNVEGTSRLDCTRAPHPNGRAPKYPTNRCG